MPEVNAVDRGWSLLAAGIALGFSASASADPTQVCVDAHHAAQLDTARGALLAARRELGTCAAADCPELLRSDCARWLAPLAARIPSVVLAPYDASGTVVTDARVAIDDGAPEPITGRALELDPGAHRFAFTAPGKRSQTREVVVLEGATGQAVEVTLAADNAGRPLPDSPAIPQLGSHASRATWMLAGAGTIALGVGVGFGLAGLHAKSALDDAGCAPDCAMADVDRVHGRFVVADVAFVGSLAAFAAATIVYIVNRDHGAQPPHGAELVLRF
jgi:hypothetical protein